MNRIESQSILTDEVSFPLAEQLRQSILVTQQKWRNKALTFEADLQETDYTGSEALLKEVWLNLLDNAAKFSPEGGTVGVTLRHEKNARTVIITDQDIDEQELKAVIDGTGYESGAVKKEPYEKKGLFGFLK